MTHPPQGPNPWGQHGPPSGGFPASGRFPQGQPPPYGQPPPGYGSQSGYSVGPPSGQPSPYGQPPPGYPGGGPPPKKPKTGIIIGSIIGALVLIGGGTTALILLLGGGGGEGGSGSGGGKEDDEEDQVRDLAHALIEAHDNRDVAAIKEVACDPANVIEDEAFVNEGQLVGDPEIKDDEAVFTLTGWEEGGRGWEETQLIARKKSDEWCIGGLVPGSDDAPDLPGSNDPGAGDILDGPGMGGGMDAPEADPESAGGPAELQELGDILLDGMREGDRETLSPVFCAPDDLKSDPMSTDDEGTEIAILDAPQRQGADQATFTVEIQQDSSQDSGELEVTAQQQSGQWCIDSIE